MSDFLVELGANRTARDLIKKLGLPIPLPQKLRRGEGPWEERPLHNLPVVFGAGSGADLVDGIAGTLARAGANVYVVGDEAGLEPFRAAGEAWARPPSRIEPGQVQEGLKPHALVFDASGMAGPQDLRAIYDFLHPWIRHLGRCGRVLILARSAATRDDPAAAAAHRAVDGLVKSVGREIGKKGSTAQTLYVDPGAEDRLEAAVRFLLSYRSAYVTGQPVHLSTTVPMPGDLPFVRPLEGKIALVTGAAQGIGNQTARALAREGARVVCVDLPSQDGPVGLLAKEIGGTPLLCDIADPDTPGKVAGTVKEQFGGIDIVVHNAGITRDKTLGNMTPDKWDAVLTVNLVGLIRLNEALLPLMKEDGRITCLSSIGGIGGNMGQTNYAASKAGVIGYVQALAPRVAGRRIAVNAVAPGFIETRMTAAIPTATREVARRLANLQQGGLPRDVAEVITFLSSPGAAGMSGEVLRICGGNYVGA